MGQGEDHSGPSAAPQKGQGVGGERPESLAHWISFGATVPPGAFWRGLEAVLLVTMTGGSYWHVVDREAGA